MKSDVIAQPSVQWNVATNIMNGDKPSIGFAGMISGISNNKLIVAGGANFPDELPWQGGKNIIPTKYMCWKEIKSNTNG
ncbi:MAG: hypothetical protein IPH58_13430 [Sphingobacteriales bacterium]|nr:hypothetical protein [Sphingobacteriales bacterium]